MNDLADDTPALSVVMPLYNKARDVARAIRSVLAQTFRDFELIVVNDGSTDGSDQVVERFEDQRVRLITQPNAGVSAARNRGISSARAALVAFIDADDEYEPDFLKNVLALRDRYPDAAAFAMNYRIVAKDSTGVPGVTMVADPTTLIDPAAYFHIGRFGSPIHSSSIAVKKEVFERSGLFPVGIRLGEDIDMWLRICFVAPIAFDRRVGSRYHLDSGNRALDTHAPPERYVFFDTIDRWVAQQPELPRNVLDDIREFKNFFIILIAHYQIQHGEARKGRASLLQCQTRFFIMRKWKWLAASFFPQRVRVAIKQVFASLRTS